MFWVRKRNVSFTHPKLMFVRHKKTDNRSNHLGVTARMYTSVVTVKAPNIAHLSLLNSVGYNKKEIQLKKCAQPNKVIIIYHLHRV